MADLANKNNVIVYRGSSEAGVAERSLFPYPIYSMDIEYHPGHISLLRVTFFAEHVFKKELEQFFRAMDYWLGRLGIGSTPDIRLSAIGRGEIQVYKMRFVRAIDLGDLDRARRLMKQIAGYLGTPSFEKFSVISGTDLKTIDAPVNGLQPA